MNLSHLKIRKYKKQMITLIIKLNKPLFCFIRFFKCIPLSWVLRLHNHSRGMRLFYFCYFHSFNLSRAYTVYIIIIIIIKLLHFNKCNQIQFLYVNRLWLQMLLILFILKIKCISIFLFESKFEKIITKKILLFYLSNVKY